MVKESIEVTLEKRAFYAESIERAIKAFDEDAKESSLSAGEIVERLDALKLNYEKFEAKHMHIRLEKANTDVLQNEYEAIESAVMRMKGKMRTLIEKSTASEPASGVVEKQASELMQTPSPIKIVFTSKFTGDQSEWYDFKRKFEKEVHGCDSVTDDEKLEVLLNACGVRMASILAMQTSYSKAWDKLNQMFDSSYNQALYAIRWAQAIPNMQAASGAKICDLVTNVNKIMQMLEKNANSTELDLAVSLIAITKLDSETFMNWERHRMVLAESWAHVEEAASIPRKPCDFVPDWESLKDFLTSEAEIFSSKVTQFKANAPASEENASRVPTYSQTLKQAAVVESSESKKEEAYVTSVQALAEAKKRQPEFLRCNLCDGIHPKFRCENFIGMSIKDRWEHVRQFKLCAKCLRPDHAGPCAAKTCNEPCPVCLPGPFFHNSFLCHNNKWLTKTEEGDASVQKTHWTADKPWGDQH